MNKHLLDQFAGRAMHLSFFNTGMRFPPSKYYNFLRVLSQMLQPKVSVELGLCGGGASYYMCRGYEQGKVIGVDKQIEYPGNLKFIQDSCSNFEFIHGDSVESAKLIFDTYGFIDLLFIDTDHTYEQTKNEYEAYLPYLSNDAVVCFDDLNREGVRQYWNELDCDKHEMKFLHEPGSATDGSFGVVWNI